MTFLAYGTRRPNDVCYYPRSNKIFWRGLGLIARLEPLDYDDGEPRTDASPGESSRARMFQRLSPPKKA